MTQHQLQGRSEKEILWFQRRDTLKAAAAWVAMGGLPAAMAQQRSNIVELRGDALINGSRLQNGRTIMTGDQLQTGPGSNLMFVIGNSAFQVRENSVMTVERGTTLNTVSLLRMITGAVVSVSKVPCRYSSEYVRIVISGKGSTKPNQKKTVLK